MDQIEKALKCQITRVGTDEVEEMEKTIKDGECRTARLPRRQ